jgi:hypothetical protein
VSGITKAEREARDFLRLNAWDDTFYPPKGRYPPSMRQNCARHIVELLEVIAKLRRRNVV